MTAPTAPDLVVQVVLHRTPPDALRAHVEALAHSTALARRAGAVGDVRVAYGDCSARRCLTAETVADLDTVARVGGLGGVGYTFFDANLGSAGGSNRLAERHDSELFVVLNPDALPEARFVTELLAVLADPGVGLCDGRQLPLEHPKAYDPETGDTSWASGACMGVRRVMFDDVGGFAAEHFPLYGDDVDLSWRARLAGWRVAHAPRALVFHDKRLDQEGRVVASETERFHSFLARLLLVRRWGEERDLDEQVAHLEAAAVTERAASDALAEWRRRNAAGSLPAPVSGAAAVARFVHGNYGSMRF
jgi:GT2 family glycosyltransferase